MKGLNRRPGFSTLVRMTYMSPLSFHPFLSFLEKKETGGAERKKPPPISLCLIPVPVSGWPETRFAQTIGPEFPLPLTSIAPSGPARLRMGGEAEWDFDVWCRRAGSGAVIGCIGRRAPLRPLASSPQEGRALCSVIISVFRLCTCVNLDIY